MPKNNNCAGYIGPQGYSTLGRRGKSALNNVHPQIEAFLKTNVN